MLPPSHITFTLAAFSLLKRKLPPNLNLDQRWLAVAAMGPDLIDKPLAWAYYYRKHGAAVLFAHTGMVHLAILIFALWKKPKYWPYLAAFNGHAILDRLWFFKHTWLWPFTGWRFHVWKQEGDEHGDIKLAYWQAFTRRPDLWGWELAGLLAGLWLMWRHKLYEPRRLIALCLTGRMPD